MQKCEASKTKNRGKAAKTTWRPIWSKGWKVLKCAFTSYSRCAETWLQFFVHNRHQHTRSRFRTLIGKVWILVQESLELSSKISSSLLTPWNLYAFDVLALLANEESHIRPKCRSITTSNLVTPHIAKVTWFDLLHVFLVCLDFARNKTAICINAQYQQNHKCHLNVQNVYKNKCVHVHVWM